MRTPSASLADVLPQLQSPPTDPSHGRMVPFREEAQRASAWETMSNDVASRTDWGPPMGWCERKTETGFVIEVYWPKAG